MMFSHDNSRRIVRSWPGEGTLETIHQDENGNTYREISEAEARMVLNSTGGRVFHIRDGRVR
jgi:hypothetical protein